MKRFSKVLMACTLFAVALSGCGNSGGGAPKKTYTITWNNYDGTLLEKDEKVKEGSMPSYDGATPTRAEDGVYTYSWSGWDPALSEVTGDQTYTATFDRTKITYLINFDLNGGTSASWDGQPKTVEELSKDVFFFDCVKAEYNFRGWYYNNQKVFDEKGNQVSSPSMAKSMTFVAMYSQTAKLTIYKNIEAAGEVSGAGEYAYNTDVNIEATCTDDYVFLGWYVGNVLVSSQLKYKFRMWSEDVTLEARYTPMMYHLHIESNNPTMGLVGIQSGESTANTAFEDKYCEKGSPITVVAYTFTETRFLGWFDEDGELVNTSAIYSFVMPGEEYSLFAKWNHFNITYNLNSGENHPDNPSEYTVEDADITLKNPTREGYDFLGWKSEDEFITVIHTNSMKHYELEAVWDTAEYTVTYVLSGGTNDEDNPDSYSYFDDDILLYPAHRTGYTFKGWYLNSEYTSESKITKIESHTSGNLTIYAKWEVIEYSITYDLNGGDSNHPDNQSTYTVESAFTFGDASRTGYTFTGWYKSGTEIKVTEIKVGTTGALSLVASWEKTKFNLNVYANDDDYGTVTINKGTGVYNEFISVTATPKSGCGFKAWYMGSTLYSSSESTSFYMPAYNVSLEARFYSPDEYEDIRLGKEAHITNNGTITYGLYPQTKITNSSLISALSALPVPADEFFWNYNGDYYTRKIKGEDYLWFKCEPLEWKIVKSSKYDNSHTEYQLLCTKVIDTREFNDSTANRTIGGKTIYPNNYQHSDIRAYLTGDFATHAFGWRKNVVAELLGYVITELNESFTDYVYLFSSEEYSELYGTNYSQRACSYTEYASSFNPEDYYMTRTAYPLSNIYTRIYAYNKDTGSAGSSSMQVNYWYGIRPAINILYNNSIH